MKCKKNRLNANFLILLGLLILALYSEQENLLDDKKIVIYFLKATYYNFLKGCKKETLVSILVLHFCALYPSGQCSKHCDARFNCLPTPKNLIDPAK